jgi:hypothetical protein
MKDFEGEIKGWCDSLERMQQQERVLNRAMSYGGCYEAPQHPDFAAMPPTGQLGWLQGQVTEAKDKLRELIGEVEALPVFHRRNGIPVGEFRQVQAEKEWWTDLLRRPKALVRD